jgi:Glycosyltransferases, probably involved in cell wall biogenesis
MKKKKQLSSLARLLLWSHAVSVAGFYTVQWLRTYPNKEDYVRKLPLPHPQPNQPATEQDTPRISIIVPARNEEQNIRRCVTSLLNQDYTNYEVIVVDDGSTDRTASILDELIASHPQGKHLFVLRLKDQLPAGWAGKPHAIHTGVQEASGNWLLLTDADTWHAPEALRSALTQAQHEHADMFSVATQQELPTFWDKVMMPMAFMGIFMLYPPRQVNDPESPIALANGQFILIKRSVYDTIGGYARPELKATLLDDRDLAYTVKHAGYRLHFVDGRQLASVHMYPRLSDAWKGWRKNAYLGNRGGLAFVLLQLLGLPTITVLPFLLPLLLLYRRCTRRRAAITATTINGVTALELGPLLAYRIWLNRGMEIPWYYSFTHPLAGAIFEGILAQSTWRIITGKGVDWRGRQYHKHNA